MTQVLGVQRLARAGVRRLQREAAARLQNPSHLTE
jgi:hypothetical protein